MEIKIIMDNRLFAFFDSLWDYIDSGKFYRNPFSLVYIAIASLNLLFPIHVIYTIIRSGVFEYISGGKVFAFIFIFFLLIFLGLMSFHLWINRQQKIQEYFGNDNEFIVIPIVSHFIQTLGEWLGFYLGIGGCVISLVFVIFGFNEYIIGEALGNSLLPMGTSLVTVIIYPIMGFLIVVAGRLIAELYKVLTSIANNTKKIVENSNNNTKTSSLEDESQF